MGRSLRSTAKKSRDVRYKRKLTGSSSWFKNNRKNKPKYSKQGGSPKTKPGEQLEQHIDTKTILFVEYTKDGEFANNLREMMKRLAPTLGFNVKIVERAGTNLGSKFPLSNLWEGITCGRIDCITCNQGAEMPVTVFFDYRRKLTGKIHT